MIVDSSCPLWAKVMKPILCIGLLCAFLSLREPSASSPPLPPEMLVLLEDGVMPGQPTSQSCNYSQCDVRLCKYEPSCGHKISIALNSRSKNLCFCVTLKTLKERQ
jgi:hypothetical protein